VLRRRGGPPAFEGVERSGRIATRTAANELNNLLKLAWPELSHDLVDAPLLEQQNGRYDRLGYTLSGGPCTDALSRTIPKALVIAAAYRAGGLDASGER
jgi:hypothetical protein